MSKRPVLVAIPERRLSEDFSILEGTREVAAVDCSVWREKAQLLVDGEEFAVYREGLASGDFILDKDASLVAMAEKPSAFFNRFRVIHDGREFVFKRRSSFRREMILLEGGREIGSVFPLRLFAREYGVDLPTDLPMAVRAFIVWLFLIIDRRQRRSSS